MGIKDDVQELQFDRTRMWVFMEEMNSKIDTILEVVVPMRRELTEVKEIIQDIPEMKADIKTIKYALGQTNKQVQNHETRITSLEARAI